MKIDERVDKELTKKNLKAGYQARKTEKQKKEERKRVFKTKSPNAPISPGAGAKSVNLGGTPNGVPPGANASRWDYDAVNKKYLTGSAKEAKRKGLWDNYRKIQKARGKKQSPFNKMVTSKPNRGSLKHGQ